MKMAVDNFRNNEAKERRALPAQKRFEFDKRDSNELLLQRRYPELTEIEQQEWREKLELRMRMVAAFQALDRWRDEHGESTGVR